jgi:hypothetical protein
MPGILEAILYPLFEWLHSASNEASNYSNSTQALILHRPDLGQEWADPFYLHGALDLFVPASIGHWCGITMHF